MADSSRHILTIFGEALERASHEDQASYLERACHGDAELRARVEALLQAHRESGKFLAGNPDAPRPAATVEAHLDLLGRWLHKYGRPKALYSDRHSIFEPQDKGKALPDAETQFGRALRELGIELIRAHSPQAKGRVERSFGTAQDRWVKELRLAGARTAGEANAVLDRLLPAHNRRFAKPAPDGVRGRDSKGFR